MSHHQQHLTIGAVAQGTGVSAQAIRYYERIGLLPRPVRQPNGYRLYSEMDVKRVLLLARVRSLGTPLPLRNPWSLRLIMRAVPMSRGICWHLLRLAWARSMQRSQHCTSPVWRWRRSRGRSPLSPLSAINRSRSALMCSASPSLNAVPHQERRKTP